jgi:hypothetical protein
LWIYKIFNLKQKNLIAKVVTCTSVHNILDEVSISNHHNQIHGSFIIMATHDLLTRINENGDQMRGCLQACDLLMDGTDVPSGSIEIQH